MGEKDGLVMTKRMARLDPAIPIHRVTSEAKLKPKPGTGMSPEMMRVLSRITGESLVAYSNPGGFIEGMRERAFELTRARRWKALAKQLYRRLRLSELSYEKLCEAAAAEARRREESRD